MAQRIGQNKVLGLAIGDRGLVVAEAFRAGAGARVTLAATFTYPPGVTLDHPGALGVALADFLKGRGFTARTAVVGVPAKWVLSRSKEVPPADTDVIADALRLQVEGEFTQEIRDLTFDYAGPTSTSESRQVLLVAMQGKHLEQVKSLAESARLQLAAVTPIGCVLGVACGTLAGKSRHAMVVAVGPGGVEFAAADGSTPRVLRHLGASTSAPGVLALELRRAAMALSTGALSTGVPTAVPANGNGHSHGTNGNGNGHHGPPLVMWDGSALNDSSRRALADAAGARLEAGDPMSIGVAPELLASSPDIVAAAAVAVAALSDEPLPADFLHSKLAEPKKPRIPRKVVIASLAALTVIVAVLWAWLDVRRLENDLQARNAEHARLLPLSKTAETFNTRVGFAQSWNRSKAQYIECLAQLRKAIPGNSVKAYLTNFTLNENLEGSFSGRAQSVEDCQRIQDLLRASRRFEVNVRYDKKDMGRGNVEFIFTAPFRFIPESATTQPAPAQPAVAAPSPARR